MTPRQIEVFRAVMLSGTVTAAAGRLNVSQPAVSKQIHLLEDSVGFTLFKRSGNRLEPTVEALLLQDKIETVYTGLEQVSQFAEAIRDHRIGEVVLGTMPLLAEFWLPRILAEQALKAQSAQLFVPVRSSDWIYRATAAGRMDFGLCLTDPAAPSGVSQEPLFRLPLVCLMRPGHRFETMDRIALKELDHERFVRLRSFESGGTELRVLSQVAPRTPAHIEVFTTAAASEIVQAGFGLTIVDVLTAEAFEARGLITRPLERLATLDLSLIEPRYRETSRLAKRLKDELLDRARVKQEEIDRRMGAD